IRQYPVGRTLFSTPNELEMHQGSLKPCREKPTREELLSHYIHFVLDNDLRINTGEEVTSIHRFPSNGSFAVRTTANEYSASRLLFTIGAMDHPRQLNVSGESLAKVHHRFIDPYPYVRK